MPGLSDRDYADILIALDNLYDEYKAQVVYFAREREDGLVDYWANKAKHIAQLREKVEKARLAQ